MVRDDQTLPLGGPSRRVIVAVRRIIGHLVLAVSLVLVVLVVRSVVVVVMDRGTAAFGRGRREQRRQRTVLVR